MNHGKILKIAISIVFIAILVFIVRYLTDSERINLPFHQPTRWIYEGEYLTEGGGKKIRMKAAEHQIILERIFEVEGEEQYLLSFEVGGDRREAFILTQDEKGLHLMERRNKVLVIPAEVRRNENWQFKFAATDVNGKMGASRMIDTPLGRYRAREIFLQSTTRSRIKLWINNDVGVVALEYSYLGAGANRNNAFLTLKSVETID